MKIVLKPITVRDIFSGYKDNAEEGVVGYGGKLNIRPAYQREYVYKEEQRNEVIRTVTRGFPNTEFPLNVMYWAKTDEDNFELIDGQQRTISLCRYVNKEFSILIDGMPQNFDNLSQEKKDHILNYKLQIYICTGTADERLEWFSIINLAGEPLTEQELLNANFTGPWLSNAKLFFMKSNSAAYGLGSKYTTIEANQSRGKGLETAIKWISKDNIKQYMADHQNDTDADALWQHFKLVIEWIEKTFTNYYSEMKGLNWGQLYDEYHEKNYDPKKVSKQVSALFDDEFVGKSKGIFEYILGGSIDSKLLEVRVFDTGIIKSVYSKQTKAAKTNKKSNCPLCAIGNNANKNKIWELKEMDADHVKAWSKKGKTSIENCEMLCVTHNRAKGNR
jgi:5-methylcytosine-specific restriction endonuclease McrA